VIFDQPDILYEKMKNNAVDWNIEKFIKFRMDELSLSERVPPPTMFTVRGPEGKTSWSRGIWSEDGQFYIKYKTEYANSQITTTLLKNKQRWTSDIVSDYFKFPDQQKKLAASREKTTWYLKRLVVLVLIIFGFILGRLTV
jgi:hypothetical protein